MDSESKIIKTGNAGETLKVQAASMERAMGSAFQVKVFSSSL